MRSVDISCYSLIALANAAEVVARAAAALGDGVRVGVIAEQVPGDLDARVDVVGHPADTDAYAHSLYRFLRAADARALDVVLVVPPAAIGLGAAVADRLRRAAGAGGHG